MLHDCDGSEDMSDERRNEHGDFESGVSMSHRTDREIAKLIQQATDPTERAMLMVLLQINRSLHDTSVATASLAEQMEEQKTALETYVKQGMALVNSGRGAWKATVMIGGIACTGMFALLGYIAKENIEAIKTMQMEMRLQAARITRIEMEHEYRFKLPPAMGESGR